MKRALFVTSAGILSIAVAVYATVQCFTATMAGSALVGVPSHADLRHHYAMVSWLWLLLAVASVAVLVTCVVAIARR